MSIEDNRGGFGPGCVYMFLTPFVLAGLGALCLGVAELVQGGTEREGLFALFGVGALFTLVPGSLLWGLGSAMEKAKEMERRKARFPEEPWRWRADWEVGRIEPALSRSLYFQWLFGIVFTAMGVYLLCNWNDVMKDGSKGYAFLTVPLFGGIALIPAIYATVRWNKFRFALCELETIPGRVGGGFRALIHARVNPSPDGKVTVRLTCFRYSETSGVDTGHGTRRMLWQDDYSLPYAQLEVSHDDGGVVIPVDFSIPETCEPTTQRLLAEHIEWELTVSAKTQGIGMRAVYVVPIFLTVPKATDAMTAMNHSVD